MRPTTLMTLDVGAASTAEGEVRTACQPIGKWWSAKQCMIAIELPTSGDQLRAAARNPELQAKAVEARAIAQALRVAD
jgi:hypothetical protein